MHWTVIGQLINEQLYALAFFAEWKETKGSVNRKDARWGHHIVTNSVYGVIGGRRENAVKSIRFITWFYFGSLKMQFILL